jgi:hypothetical protein
MSQTQSQGLHQAFSDAGGLGNSPLEPKKIKTVIRTRKKRTLQNFSDGKNDL